MSAVPPGFYINQTKVVPNISRLISVAARMVHGPNQSRQWMETQIQMHKYKYTNTNAQIQIHKHKCTNTNAQIRIRMVFGAWPNLNQSGQWMEMAATKKSQLCNSGHQQTFKPRYKFLTTGQSIIIV